MDHFLLYCALGVCTLQVLYNEKGSKDKGVISDLKNAKLLWLLQTLVNLKSQGDCIDCLHVFQMA